MKWKKLFSVGEREGNEGGEREREKERERKRERERQIDRQIWASYLNYVQPFQSLNKITKCARFAVAMEIRMRV